MRLLNVKTRQLESFNKDVPAYAILSHTWGKIGEEIQYSDVIGKDGPSHVQRSVKLQGACSQAEADKLEYIWIDTICIDKSSSNELTESINSMFRWYQGAAICYTYLFDVTVVDGDRERQIQAKLAACRWFTRGWTLQELLAPEDLKFFDSQWRCFGSRSTLCETIEEITHIHHDHLLFIKDVTDASVAQRISWVARRNTTKDEDMAYCLLGLFDIAMPVIYGEGGFKAFQRLQDEILKKPGIKDDSIFAWGLEDTKHPENLASPIPGGLFAPSPTAFAGSETIVSPSQSEWNPPRLVPYTGILLHQLLIFSTAEDDEYWILPCRPETGLDLVVGIPIQKSDLPTGGYFRPRNKPCRLFPSSSRTSARSEESPVEPYERKEPTTSSAAQYWFWVKPPVGGDYELSDEVEPPVRRGKNKTLIGTGIQGNSKSVSPTFIRFNLGITQPPGSSACDFILVLQPEYRIESPGSSSKPSVHCSIMTCDRSTSLKDVAVEFSTFEKKSRASQIASNGHVEMSVTTPLSLSDTKFHIQPTVKRDSSFRGINATKELAAPRIGRLTSDFVGGMESQQRRIADLEQLVATHSARRRELEAVLTSIGNEAFDLAQIGINLQVHKEDESKDIQEAFDRELAELTRKQRDLEELRAEHMRQLEQRYEKDLTMLEKRQEVTKLRKNEASAKVKEVDTFTDAFNFEKAEAKMKCLDLQKNFALQLSAQVPMVEKIRGVSENQFHDSPEYLLAYYGHVDSYRLFYDTVMTRGFSESRSCGGMTPLMLAAGKGHIDLVQMILEEKYCDLLSVDNYGRTALWFAACNGKVGIVEALLDRYEKRPKLDGLNKADEDGNTPLMVAARNGHTATVTALLGFHDGQEKIEYLRAKAKLDQRTALSIAVCFGDADTVKILLEAEAGASPPVDHIDYRGHSPLATAIRNNRLAVIELLVSRMKNPEEAFISDETIVPVLQKASSDGDKFRSVVEFVFKKAPSLATKVRRGTSPSTKVVHKPPVRQPKEPVTLLEPAKPLHILVASPDTTKLAKRSGFLKRFSRSGHS